MVTEQVIRGRGGGTAAHQALRGSVPVLWSQAPNLLPKPPLRIAPLPASLPPFRAHLAALRTAHGGPVAMLSLLRASGTEAPLGDAFAAAAASLGVLAPGDALLPFDFNAAAGASARGRAALLEQARAPIRAPRAPMRRSG